MVIVLLSLLQDIVLAYYMDHIMPMKTSTQEVATITDLLHIREWKINQQKLRYLLPQ